LTRSTDERSPWSAWVEDACRSVEAAGRWRAPRTFDAHGPNGVLDDPPTRTGEAGAMETAHRSPVVSFASNDYLGLSAHSSVVAAAQAALDRWGSGSGASRLVTGSRPVHAELEAALAEWKGCERALVFPTGFAANLSVLSLFGSEGVHVHSDALNHASIVDGCRLARASVHVYPHRDLGALEGTLASRPGRQLVVSDTVFSMDGDTADLEGLCSLAARHGALLVLDEAHAVLGPDLPESSPRLGAGLDVLRVGTLSKALGSLGGYVAGPAQFIDLLVNRARPYIFTTAPTPADTAAALCALGIVRTEEGRQLRRRLAAHVARVAASLGMAGHATPILPVTIGAEADAVAASDELAACGLWVPAIRPPTVAPGTSRLRVTLSAAHSDQEVSRLLDAFRALDLLGAHGAHEAHEAPAALGVSDGGSHEPARREEGGTESAAGSRGEDHLAS
jgi:8-amino-7-oxononanoate synthase